MVAMRQNLTSVVEDGVANPWKRWWWGAAPAWAEEQTYIVRSGLCVTKEGHMAFLWGDSLGPDELAKAMLALRCARGMHLDMNSKHTGLELYRPYPPESPPQPLGRPLTEQEHEGPIEQGRGFTFRTRLAVKLMTPLRFPRYLERDPRDFFFLSLKSLLPGPDVWVAGAKRVFSTDGLPHAGWPPALARAPLGGADAGLEGSWLVRIDPARALPAPLAPPELTRPLARLVGLDAAPTDVPSAALFAVRQKGSAVRYQIGEPPERAAVVLRAPLLSADASATRAIGVDREGFIVYAEIAKGDAGQLRSWLAQAGVEHALALPKRAALGFELDGDLVSVDGGRELDADDEGLVWVAETRPAASAMFPDVAPRPYYHWAGLQGQRVRYFPAHAPTARAPAEAMVPVEEAEAIPPGKRKAP
jgi:hypothetical protein